VTDAEVDVLDGLLVFFIVFVVVAVSVSFFVQAGVVGSYSSSGIFADGPDLSLEVLQLVGELDWGEEATEVLARSSQAHEIHPVEDFDGLELQLQCEI
jgi:hypothetical protein